MKVRVAGMRRMTAKTGRDVFVEASLMALTLSSGMRRAWLRIRPSDQWPCRRS